MSILERQQCNTWLQDLEQAEGCWAKPFLARHQMLHAVSVTFWGRSRLRSGGDGGHTNMVCIHDLQVQCSVKTGEDRIERSGVIRKPAQSMEEFLADEISPPLRVRDGTCSCY